MSTIVKMEITLADDGQVQVNGPIADKVLCYGLLAVAGDIIRTYDPGKQPLVIPATRMLPGNGRHPAGP